MSVIKVISVLFLLNFISITSASPAKKKAAPPPTDIVLCTLLDSAGAIRLEETVNITKNAAHNDEPEFYNGDTLLFTSVRENRQSAIYAYNMKTGKTSKITHGKQSEFDPARGIGGNQISFIREEPDSARRVWRGKLTTHTPALVFSKIRHAVTAVWVDEETIALTERENDGSCSLRMYDFAKTDERPIAVAVGRCIRKVPGNPGLSFTHLINDTMKICVYDFNTLKTIPLIPTLPHNEEYAWGPERRIYSSDGAKLYTALLPHEKQWAEFADLASKGFGTILRMAINPKGNRMAMAVGKAAAKAIKKKAKK